MRFFLVLIGILFVRLPLLAASYHTEDHGSVGVIYLTGETGEEDIDELSSLLKGPSTKVLVLDSKGGEVVSAAVTMGAIADFPNVHVFVPKLCASACVLIYGGASSKNRYATKKAEFVFHAGHVDEKPVAGASILMVLFLESFINSSWMAQKENIDMFSSYKPSFFSALEMASNGSGLLEKENLVGSVEELIARLTPKN